MGTIEMLGQLMASISENDIVINIFHSTSTIYKNSPFLVNQATSQNMKNNPVSAEERKPAEKRHSSLSAAPEDLAGADEVEVDVEEVEVEFIREEDGRILLDGEVAEGEAMLDDALVDGALLEVELDAPVDDVLDVAGVELVVAGVELVGRPPAPGPPSWRMAARRKVSILSFGPGLTIMTMPKPQCGKQCT